MDAQLTKIYRGLCRDALGNSLRAPSSLLNEISGMIDTADGDIGRNGWSIRDDARLFLIINFSYIVAIPLASKMDSAQLLEFVRHDIHRLVWWAVEARRGREVDRLVSSHAILEAAQQHWDELATTAHWLKVQG